MGKGPPIGHPPYPGGGRPPKYTNEILDGLADSLNAWVDEAIQNKKNFLLGDWCFENDFLPQNFYRYADKNESFGRAYQRAKAWQEHMITKGALFGKLNPKFAQFFLGCNHDWRTKEVIEHQGNEPIQVIYYGTKEPKKWQSESSKAKIQNAANDKG
jgi:hypothetical protein